MKVVIYSLLFKDDFERVLNMVLEFGIILEKNLYISTKTMNEDQDYIYIKYKNNQYKFYRYNPKFIESVEKAIKESPFLQYEGPLHIVNIDDRFTNKKYYKITRENGHEYLTINKDIIIEDLYNNQLEV
jgi:hypothetical protein